MAPGDMDSVMNQKEILTGILELYSSCVPDDSGYVTSESLGKELGKRVPGRKVEDMACLVNLEPGSNMLFIDFWSVLERSVSGRRISGDLDCLRFLRDKILNEGSKLKSTLAGHISHTRLMEILRDVRERASNKETWDEAIQSSGGSGLRTHSITAISGAVKAMLEDYVQSLDEDFEARDFPDQSEEIESLKHELAAVQSNVSRLTNELQASAASMGNANQKIAQTVSELSETKSALKTALDETEKLHKENSELRNRIAQVEIPLDGMLSHSVPPTMDEWKSVLMQLAYLRSMLGEDKAVLLSQIQTLEVQKSDAEEELTRLRSALAARAAPSLAPSVISSLRKFRVNTVSVHGLDSTCSTRRSSLAEQFVDIAPTVRSSARKARGDQPQQCVQQ